MDNTATTSWSKYAEYQNSKIEWLGRVPSHWAIMKLGFIVRMESGESITAQSFTESGYPVYGGNGQRGYTEKYTNEGEHVLIGRQGALCGNVNYANGKFYASEHAVVVYPILPVETKWIGELIRTADLNRLSQTAAQPGLSVDVVAKVKVPYAPPTEQKAIAAFLDEKTAKIDQAIQIKEQQIALLKERKQIIIQQAVTRGLNPDAPMKDSGIDWIGEIPAHWDVRRNATLFRESKLPGDKELPVLSVSIHSGVSSKELSAEENIRSAIKIADRTSYKRVKAGYVAYNMMRAWQGGIGAVEVDGMVSPAYVVAAPFTEINAEYFEYLYRTPVFIWQMDSNSKGITDFRKRLYWDNFKGLLTIIPPLTEQSDIVDSIQDLTEKVEKALQLKSKQIEILQEYKTTLINEAVTGKIKVA